MKIITSIKKHFFSEEKNLSSTQLNIDYGDFPPIPLQCIDRKIEFTVVKTYGLGNLYFNLITLIKIIKVAQLDITSPSGKINKYYDSKLILEIKKGLENYLYGSTFKKYYL